MNLNAEYLPKNDPIMQELWAIKAQINKEAGYSVEEIVRRMREKYPTQASGSQQSNGDLECPKLPDMPMR